MRRWAPALMTALTVIAGAGCASAPGGQGHPVPSPARPALPSSAPAPSGSPAPDRSSPRARQSSSPASRPVPPAGSRVLAPGMSGPDVRQLQQRLAALKYDPGPADGQFGPYTLEAVWAFQEAQGLTPADHVGPAMWRALARPRPPPVLAPGGGSLRVEISLSRELLVLYRGGQVALISHVSTGGGYYYCSPGGGCGYAITPAGDFSTVSFTPGWVTVPLGEMYDPVFFIDHAYAIHGASYVPLQPASHGCVRLPMNIAGYFHTLVPVPGTPVYVRR